MYEVTTHVEINTPEFINVPSIIICVVTYKLFDWSKMTKMEKRKLIIDPKKDNQTIFSGIEIHDLDKINSTTFEQMIDQANDLQLKSLMSNARLNFETSDLFRITKNRQETFEYLHFDPDEKDIRKNFSSLVIERQYFSLVHRFKCFHLELKGHIGRLNYISVITSRGRILSHFRFNKLIQKRLGTTLYLLAPSGQNLKNRGSTKWLSLNLSKQAYRLTYNEYRSTLLPPPFTTKCRNYTKEGLNAKEGCFYACMRNLSLSMFGKLDPDNRIFPDEKEKPLLEFNREYRGMQANCTQKCSQEECMSHCIVPLIIGTAAQGGIVQHPSQTPIIRSDCTQRVPLIQFFTEAGSTLGFWFGLSIMDITQVFGNSIKKLAYRKRKQQIRSLSEQHSSTRQVINEIKAIKRNQHKIRNSLVLIRNRQDDFLRCQSELKSRVDTLTKQYHDFRTNVANIRRH